MSANDMAALAPGAPAPHLRGMIWCDRAALLWAIVLILAICVLQTGGGFSYSLRPENIMGGWGQLLLKLVVAPWAVFRLIDLVCDGPARRSGRFIVRPQR